MTQTPALVTDPDRVDQIAGAVRDAGLFAFDVEFMSEGRFIPELSLIQVAWGDPAAPRAEAIDCLATDPAPVLALVADPDITTIVHAPRQDLGMLATRHKLAARSLIDSQIAAALLGLGHQIGYGKLIDAALGVHVDKGAQFTAWLDRPLSATQIRYALDDVFYLLRAWATLRDQLAERGRLAWARDETARQVAAITSVGAPETAYREVKGWKGLRGAALGSLRAVAAWRRRTALDSNQPPGWILPDAAMIELAKRQASRPRDLLAARGVGRGTVRRYGEAILAEIARGAADRVQPFRGASDALSPRAQVWAAIVNQIVAAEAEAASISAKLVGTRADAEALARWYDRGGDRRDDNGDNGDSDANNGDSDGGDRPLLLTGWRRALCGDAALAWLRGERAIAAADTAAGLTLVHPS